MTARAPLEQPLTAPEVMDHLRISRGTYWRYIRQYPRQFRTFLSGNKRLMDRADLERWKDFKKRLDNA